MAVLLVVSQLYSHETVREGATSTVAALVGMVPQGLVLLTSVALVRAAEGVNPRSGSDSPRGYHPPK